MATECPSESCLIAFVAGELSEADARSVAGHLDFCPSCSMRVDAIEPKAPSIQEDPGGYSLWNIQRVAAAARNGRLVSEMSHFQLGKTIGDYRLIRVLGRGGMGIVFEAEHLVQHRRVAFKVLSTHRTTDAAFVERFKNEIRIAQAVDSDYFVRCLDAGMHDDQPYLVMELLQGFSLEDLVRNWGTLPLAEACEIGRQLAAALKVLKEQGFVHRDLKPANVMIAWRHSSIQFKAESSADESSDSTEWKSPPSVVVLDFGVARSLSGIGLQTTGHVILGTLDHMAPEQIRGSSVGPEADAYTLGTTLFKLLVGRAPLELIERSTDAKIGRLISFRAVSIRELRPDLPRRVTRIIDSLLALNPQDRPSPDGVHDAVSVFAKGADLRWLLEKVPAAPRPQPQYDTSDIRVSRLSRFSRRPSTWVMGALLVLIGAWLGYSRISRPEWTDVGIPNYPLEGELKYLASTEVGQAGELTGHQSHVTSLAVNHAEDRVLSTGQETREIILWDLNSGTAERVFRHHLTGQTRSVTFLSDEIGASGATDGTIVIFNLRSGDVIAQLDDRKGAVMSLAAVPGQPDWLMSAGGDSGTENNDIHIWDWPKTKVVRTFSGHMDRVYPATVSPNGKFIASTSHDRTVRVWNISDEVEVRSWKACEANESLTWFPDSRQIVAGAPDFSLAVYDVESGKEMQRIPQQGRIALRVSVSSDGHLILTTHGHDPFVNLWDVSTGARVYTFLGNVNEVYSCALLKSGKFALVAGGWWDTRNKDDFALRLWRLPVRQP